MEAIGFIEFNSIAKGIETADTVLKTAQIGLESAIASCPGKYYLLFTGEVAAVQSSVDAGLITGGSYVIDSCVIANVHPQVVRAVHMTAMPHNFNAVGVMEFFSVTAAIYASDAAVKAADTEIVELRLGTGIGGKSYVVLTGEVAAVREAVQCGIHTENAAGMTVSHVVIPFPHPELLESLY